VSECVFWLLMLFMVGATRPLSLTHRRCPKRASRTACPKPHSSLPNIPTRRRRRRRMVSRENWRRKQTTRATYGEKDVVELGHATKVKISGGRTDNVVGRERGREIGKDLVGEAQLIDDVVQRHRQQHEIPVRIGHTAIIDAAFASLVS
jgi:hypothetical protein